MRMHLKHLALGLTLLAGLVAVMPKIAHATVTNTVVSSTYMGDGATTLFTIAFDFQATSWITVTVNGTALSQGSGSGKFTITTSSGGTCAVSTSGPGTCTTVDFGTAPILGATIVIARSIPLTQTVAFSPTGIFPYQGLSNQMDQITMILQNLNAGIPQGGSGGGGEESTPVYNTAYNLWGWDSSGSTLVEYPGSTVTLSANDILQFNGSGWVNAQLTANSLMTLLGGQTTYKLASGAGGTGVSNAGTLTYGHNLTFTTTGDTNVTLPTSGTLLAGTASTSNVAGDVVLRDGSGNFSSNVITANSFVGPLTGAVTGNVTGNVSGTSSNITGTVAIGHGGTGQTTQQTAINALLNTGSASSNTYARFDGTNVTLGALLNTDMPSNIAWSKMAQQTHNSLLWSDNSGNEGVIATNVNSGYVLTSNGVAPFWGPVGAGIPGLFPYGADTGTANTYVVATPNPPVPILSAGIGLSFIAAHTNTGTSSLNVTSLGAINITHGDLTNLSAGDILAGQMVIVQYDGTEFQLINPTESGSTPGGSSSQVQYNSSGSLAGSSGFTYDGSGSITLSSGLNAASANITGLTASKPVFTDGSKNLSSGSASGNTTKVVTTTGTLTSGHCSQWDASGNAVDSGATCAGSSITALTGDGTASGPGSAALTLATVNTNTGSFGSSTSIPSFTVNGKGLITAASGNVVIAPAGTLSGTTLNSTVVSSSLTSVGTIATGVWNGSIIGTPYTTVANQALTTCTTARTVDWSTGSSFTLTLTNSDTCAITFSNQASGQTITIAYYQPGTTGSAAVSYSGVKWAGGTVPTMTTGASATDTCTFVYNGTDTRGSCVQAFQ